MNLETASLVPGGGQNIGLNRTSKGAAATQPRGDGDLGQEKVGRLELVGQLTDWMCVLERGESEIIPGFLIFRTGRMGFPLAEVNKCLERKMFKREEQEFSLDVLVKFKMTHGQGDQTAQLDYTILVYPVFMMQ